MLLRGGVGIEVFLFVLRRVSRGRVRALSRLLLVNIIDLQVLLLLDLLHAPCRLELLRVGLLLLTLRLLIITGHANIRRIHFHELLMGPGGIGNAEIEKLLVQLLIYQLLVLGHIKEGAGAAAASLRATSFRGRKGRLLLVFGGIKGFERKILSLIHQARLVIHRLEAQFLLLLSICLPVPSLRLPQASCVVIRRLSASPKER